MNIAIFGASGIVGKAIVKEALEKGHQVTVLLLGKVTKSYREYEPITKIYCFSDFGVLNTKL